MEMFWTRKNQSRKRLLQTMGGELDMVEALGLCAATMKRPRKERGADEERSSAWWRNGYWNWDDTAFKKRLRTNRATFQFILGEIEDQLVKEPTRFKPEPIPPDTQLAICLYRLAYGCTYSTVGDLFGVASVIFNQVCKILVSTLYDRCVYLPRNRAELNIKISLLKDKILGQYSFSSRPVTQNVFSEYLPVDLSKHVLVHLSHVNGAT